MEQQVIYTATEQKMTFGDELNLIAYEHARDYTEKVYSDIRHSLMESAKRGFCKIRLLLHDKDADFGKCQSEIECVVGCIYLKYLKDLMETDDIKYDIYLRYDDKIIIDIQLIKHTGKKSDN